MIGDEQAVALGGVGLSRTADAVVAQARHYTHPALPGRSVVRVVRGNLSEVEDLSLGALGFEAGRHTDVGFVRHQAVGFPAWPIIHDPANARHALNLVADLKRAAKMARSRPGATKDLLVELANKLGRSAPHFLPTFLEEGARVFLNAGNRAYAAQLFAKAREAERVHNLAIDDARHRQVFLEFALAGALSGKELTAESRALPKRMPAEEALEFYLKLNIDRIRGGMPPFAGLGADLRRLARAAGRRAGEAEELLLREVLGSPALSRAPKAFWDGVRKPLSALTRADAGMRRALLGIVPESVDADDWVALLAECGVADELLSGQHDARGWVERMTRQLQRSWSHPYPLELGRLIARLPGLRGTRISLSRNVSLVDVNLLDAMLAAGAEVVLDETRPGTRLSFDSWAESDDDSPLTHLADGPLRENAVAGVGSSVEKHLGRLLGSDGTRTLLAEWAEPRITPDSSPVAVARELIRLNHFLVPKGRAAFPQQVAALASCLDAARLLAAGLRGGLLTELSWPALEKAVAELGQPSEVSFHGSWPAVGAARDGRIIWVERDERVAEASFTMPALHDRRSWAYLLVDGHTYFVARQRDWTHKGIWSNAPGRILDVPNTWHVGSRQQSFQVPGGRLVSSSLVRVGDASNLEGTAQLLTDGERFWTCDGDEVNEISPATGKVGRRSLPTALAELVEPLLRDGWRVGGSTSWFPAQHCPASLQPAGSGWRGWVELRHPKEGFCFVGPDGYRQDPQVKFRSVGRIARPGGGHWLFDLSGRLCEADGSELLPTTGADGANHFLGRIPPAGWHHFRPRDPAASARLRAVSARQVADLLAAVPTIAKACANDSLHAIVSGVCSGFGVVLNSAEALEAARQLCGSHEPALLEAIVWLAAQVKAIIRAGDELLNSVDEESTSFGDWEPNLSPVWWAFDGDRWRTCETKPSHLRALAQRVLSDGQKQPRWGRWLNRLPGLARLTKDRAAKAEPSPSALQFGRGAGLTLVKPELLLAAALGLGRTRDEIGGLAAAVGAVLDADLYLPESCVYSADSTPEHARQPGAVIDTPSGPSFVLVVESYQHELHTAFSPSGGAPAKLNGQPVRVLHRSSGMDPAELRKAFEVLLERGAPAWDEHQVARLAEGLGWSTAAAALVLAGLPNLDSWERNFLPKEVREQLGLKVAEAAMARGFLREISVSELVELVAAGVQDPVRAVLEGLDVEAMIAHSGKTFGDHVVVPDELIGKAERATPYGGASSLSALFQGTDLSSVRLPMWFWAVANVPCGGPLAAVLRQRFADLKKALRAPYEIDEWYPGPELRQLLGLPTRGKDGEPLHVGSCWRVGAWQVTEEKHKDLLVWDPRLVTDWRREQALLDSLPGTGWALDVRMRAALITGLFDAVAGQLDGEEGWLQDPLRSAPTVVRAAAEALDLPEESARYWLQLLALHDPTDRNIDLWNGWRKADRVRAAGPLLSAGLVVEAKRARAGRSYFLPGGWMEASQPNLPLEVWKAPFYELRDEPRVHPVHNILILLTPFAELFADAWQRFSDGDRPGYEELRTERYRRRRA
ncbi:hypothetical protein [Tessaracoccus sp. OH4464_COT-324]|uniref:hypothetical protein n=1 Tax=Tessaracoccus sp. OH4464_COT-324 TaxID=2491059 RepID=UPI000F63764F|nr:hypothetical protein [Tessaracoccus sp. OH4464_COT-324]RRD46091.1 hypothetical protein EII42_08470 [Tessaracoccus sp. OH4464_COT-324]